MIKVMNWSARLIEGNGIELVDEADELVHATIVAATPEAQALIEDAPKLLMALRACVRALQSRVGNEHLAEHFPVKLRTAQEAIASVEEKTALLYMRNK